jgi:hypothetical protein
MNLTAPEVEHFYSVWKPLLLFVNRRLNLVPEMLSIGLDDSWDVRHVQTIRDATWADDSLREAFVAENPAKLSAEDLELVRSWRHRRAGGFAVLRHLKKHSLFLDRSEVFGVLGLLTPLSELTPPPPCYVKAVLIPFGGRIIYDSLIVPYNVMLGPGIRADLEHVYQDAVERGGVITSLMPAGPEDRRGRAGATNEKVLEALRAHLYGSGLSQKVVERDLANVAAFAEPLLDRPEPVSLREIGASEASDHLSRLRGAAGVKESRRRETATSLKRLFRFLRDTGRMDYEAARHALDVLGGKE